MKLIILLLISTILIGCNEEDKKDQSPEPCVVTDLGDEVEINCPEQDPVYISNGKDGSDGKDGIDGKDGTDGKDGENGTDGASCVATQTEFGVTITCGETQVQIYNGEDGQDGIDGEDGTDATVEIIDPCGTNPDIYNEILIKFDETTYIAYFQSGNKRHLAQIKPGTYVTTDAEKCRFTITEDYEYIEE